MLIAWHDKRFKFKQSVSDTNSNENNLENWPKYVATNPSVGCVEGE